MQKKSSVPTMKDVASEAGVSLGTVSKVVNGLPVGEPYKTNVEKAIRKLDYRVNSYARGPEGKPDRHHRAAGSQSVGSVLFRAGPSYQPGAAEPPVPDVIVHHGFQCRPGAGICRYAPEQ